MAQATGAQGVPLISVVSGAIYYSLDGGVTWTEAQQPGSPSNSAAPISGNGTVATPFTIAAGALANASLANMAAATVKGSVAGGVPADLSQTQLTALVNSATTGLPGAQPVNSYILTPTRGDDLADADATIQPGSDKASMYVLQAGVLTQNRTLTIGVSGTTALAQQQALLILRPQAFSLIVKNDAGTTLATATANAQSYFLQMFFSTGSGHFALNVAGYVVNN